MILFDPQEALRFLGVREGSVNAGEVLQEVKVQTARLEFIKPRSTWRIFPLRHYTRSFVLPDTDLRLEGQTAERMLASCSEVILLACTLGAAFDRFLRAEQLRDMSQAVILDACGNAWIEAVCDGVEQEIAGQMPGRFLTDRFSPGYGDLPLSLQPGICGALDTGRRVGISVTEHLLLNPLKSVTALIGVSDQPQMARIRGCGHCTLVETCTLRKGGKSCAL